MSRPEPPTGDAWGSPEPIDIDWLEHLLEWPDIFWPPVRCYRWLPGDCDHEENLPYDYDVYLNIHDYVYEPEDD